MDTTEVVSQEWGHVLSLMPRDLEESCRANAALSRRRQLVCAADLLRLCLAYSLCDMSLRRVAAWAEVIGLGRLSDVAVLKRLRAAAPWLGRLVAQWLVERGLAAPALRGLVRLVDATTISRPGSTGTDWRLHLGLDLGAQRIVSVELTDGGGGETLRRHRPRAGQIVVADCGYASGSGLASALERGAHVVVRGQLQHTGLRTRRGGRLDLVALLETLGPDEVADWPVAVDDGARRWPMRLVAVKKSAAAAERARWRVADKARKNRTRPSRAALTAAQYIYVVTDLRREQASAVDVLELYRCRWQIELVFKRLKSVLALDALRAKSAALARTYLLGKILGALIVEELTGAALSFSPWGFCLPRAPAEPVAVAHAVG